MFGWFKKAETRDANIENPAIPVSAANILEFFGLGDALGNVTGEVVTTETALSVPAFWCGVNFLGGTIAGLPLQVYRKAKDGRKKVDNGVALVLGKAVNEETTSFAWRKDGCDQLFTEGRWLTYVEKDARGNVVNLWPLDDGKTICKRVNGRKVYTYTGGGRSIDYPARDVVDIVVMKKRNGIGHYRPVSVHRETFAQALAAMKYGSRFFQNGGVPPFTVSGPIKSAAGVDKAGKDLTQAVMDAARLRRNAIALPEGHEVKSIGVDPVKMQMLEIRRFLIEEFARILGLPKVFLMDLTQGTFTNTEQQDLQLVKHYVKRWIEQIEEELNLKLFGRESDYYVRFALDGLMRGDFLSRMQGYAAAIQNGVMKPNEARALEERENDPDGDYLMIQGATVPIRNQLKEGGANAPAKPNA